MVATFPLPDIDGRCCNGLNGGVAVTPDGKHAYFTGIVLSVIDTAANMVVDTVHFGGIPQGVAVTPDGKHAYVTIPSSPAAVAVIATSTNTVEGGTGFDLMGRSGPKEVAVTPDGKHAYLPNTYFNTVIVIDTATNTVAATIPVGNGPFGVAISPDGKRAYVTNSGDDTVSVIDTATNKVVGQPIGVGVGPNRVAVTPDGKHAYVANTGTFPNFGTTVSVIATATNTVMATVTVGAGPFGVAVTPDGKHVYVANFNPGTVSVIATATNTVVATVAVGVNPVGVGIVPPPPGIPFLAFNAKLQIQFGTAPNHDAFTLGTGITFSSTAPGFNPLTELVTLQIGTFAVTIPPGSFQKNNVGNVIFTGVINGVTLQAVIKRTGTLRYSFQAGAQHATLIGTQNAVYVTLIIGKNSGATSVTAAISP